MISLCWSDWICKGYSRIDHNGDKISQCSIGTTALFYTFKPLVRHELPPYAQHVLKRSYYHQIMPTIFCHNSCDNSFIRRSNAALPLDKTELRKREVKHWISGNKLLWICCSVDKGSDSDKWTSQKWFVKVAIEKAKRVFLTNWRKEWDVLMCTALQASLNRDKSCLGTMNVQTANSSKLLMERFLIQKILLFKKVYYFQSKIKQTNKKYTRKNKLLAFLQTFKHFQRRKESITENLDSGTVIVFPLMCYSHRIGWGALTIAHTNTHTPTHTVVWLAAMRMSLGLAIKYRLSTISVVWQREQHLMCAVKQIYSTERRTY